MRERESGEWEEICHVTYLVSYPRHREDVLTYVLYAVGEQVRIRHFSIHGLIPDTTDYLTYEGSMTQPGCHETVTWVIINKPLYMSRKQARDYDS